MKAKTYVVERQIAWAKRHEIALVTSPKDPSAVHDFEGQNKRTAYTATLEANLFEAMSPTIRAEFEAGDGSELEAKMRALYSSAALACNLFHHLCQPEFHPLLPELMGSRPGTVEKVNFEQKRRVMEQPKDHGFPRDPNLDVIIRMNSKNGPVEVAIECKCLEPWSGRPEALSSRYFEMPEFWELMPNLRAYAEKVGAGKQDAVNQHLHAAQLLKHLFGLRHENRASGKNGFELIYLWLDVPGPESEQHRKEITAFEQAASEDQIRFRSLSCQEFILRLLRYRSQFTRFVDYLTERYL